VAAPAAKIAATEAAAAATVADDSEGNTRGADRAESVSDELKKLMAGGDYDEKVVASDDRETRQLVGAELLSALVGRNLQRRERARAAFMKHGYFDDATRDLRIAGSPNERAAAARRLSFVHDREATPHLVAALDDTSPDVRRAAVEALMDLRDPAAIAPLNSLMQNENDRRVPRSLIKHAIESCATSTADESTPALSVNSVPATASTPVSVAIGTEREVIEI
jgi:HEAT repeat protein